MCCVFPTNIHFNTHFERLFKIIIVPLQQF